MQVIQLARAGRGKSKSTVQADPTPERLAKAGGNVELGDDGHGHRVMTIRDSPLERALRRNAISEKQYAAGRKFYLHWHHSCLSGFASSGDLHRVFGSDMDFSRLDRSESSTFHRQRYIAALQAVNDIPGARDALKWIVCEERPLADFGKALEWRSGDKATAAAETLLKRALGALVVLWGL